MRADRRAAADSPYDRRMKSTYVSGLIVGIVAGTAVWLISDDIVFLPIGIAIGLALGAVRKR